MKIAADSIVIEQDTVNSCWTVGFSGQLADETKRCVLVFPTKLKAEKWRIEFLDGKKALPTVNPSGYEQLSDNVVGKPVPIFKVKGD